MGWFQNGGAVQIDGVRSSIGYRVWIQRIGSISELLSVSKLVPVNVVIVMVFRTITVQILYHSGNRCGEVFIEGYIVVIRCPNGD